MKVSLLQENLNSALSHVSRFTASKAQLPILNNILVSSDEGRLKLSATNLELGINYWLGAKIEIPGEFSIPAKDISEFISYLPAGKIDLDLNDQLLLSITSPKANSTFTTMPATDFPILPVVDETKTLSLNSSLLLKTIQQVVFASAVDDSRPVLTAVLCRFTSDSVTFVATDGFRLSHKSIKFVDPLPISETQTYLIPSRCLSEIAKLSKNNETIKIGLSNEHQIIFVLNDSQLVSRLVEGDFPDYHRIMPESFSTKIYVNRFELSQSIKMASVFARASANVVRLSIKSEGIELTANAPQVGHNITRLEAKVEGEPLDIAFNYKFISDFLNIVQGEEIVIELNQPLSPGAFRDQSDPELTHIIMPVRIQD